MKVKPSVIALMLLGVYLVSTIAYLVLQPGYSTIQLPTDNIFDYKLDSQLRNLFIYYGSTILTFEYDPDCENCFEQISFLEDMTNQFKHVVASDKKNQVFSIYLEKFANESIEQSKLTIESSLGNKTIINPTYNETFDELCNLMTVPPTTCAVR